MKDNKKLSVKEEGNGRGEKEEEKYCFWREWERII